MASTDFTINIEGEVLTSDNCRNSAFFVMHGEEQIAASSPLSPVDRAHFVLAKGFGSPSRASADQSKGFVLVGHGVIEPSVGELSPSDRKLYYKRQSFSSPKVTPVATDLLPLPEDGKDLTGSFLGA